jgi:putative SOS response-associated peptidase YedK
MCGRFTLTTNLDDLQMRFNFEAADLLYQPRYNVSPTQSVLTLVNSGQNHAGLMRWGLIPSWAKDPSIGMRMINARAETVAERPSFRRALQKRRCLVLADGFYEWKKEGKRKIPMYITLKSEEPFGFAGLWEVWKNPAGEDIYSCTIITTTPNPMMEPIHNRMPVILPRELEADWLNQRVDDPSQIPCPLPCRRNGSLPGLATGELACERQPKLYPASQVTGVAWAMPLRSWLFRVASGLFGQYDTGGPPKKYKTTLFIKC